MKAMHACDFSNFLSIFDSTQTDGACYILLVECKIPLQFIFVGLLVLPIKQNEVRVSKDAVESVVKKRCMNAAIDQ